jgi:hypothetical protein
MVTVQKLLKNIHQIYFWKLTFTLSALFFFTGLFLGLSNSKGIFLGRRLITDGGIFRSYLKSDIQHHHFFIREVKIIDLAKIVPFK